MNYESQESYGNILGLNRVESLREIESDNLKD